MQVHRVNLVVVGSAGKTKPISCCPSGRAGGRCASLPNAICARSSVGQAMSIFGAAAATPSNVLLQMKAGKLVQQGTSVTSDPRKGLLILRKTEDGLMHLIWKDRASGTVEDDLIVFQNDAAMEHVPQCTSGFAMMLRFTTGRKALFWSQEPRKKGAGWEEVSKERELVKKANDILNGTTAPATAASSGARARVPAPKPPSPASKPVPDLSAPHPRLASQLASEG